MKGLLSRLYEISLDVHVEAICIGPGTYYEICSMSGAGLGPPTNRDARLQVFGKTVVVIDGIPDDEIIVASVPHPASTYRTFSDWWTTEAPRESLPFGIPRARASLIGAGH